jgi:hypothetical protein
LVLFQREAGRIPPLFGRIPTPSPSAEPFSLLILMVPDKKPGRTGISNVFLDFSFSLSFNVPLHKV